MFIIYTKNTVDIRIKKMYNYIYIFKINILAFKMKGY